MSDRAKDAKMLETLERTAKEYALYGHIHKQIDIADLLSILALAKRAEELRKYAGHLESCATSFCSCCNQKIVLPMFRHRLENSCNCGLTETLAALNAKGPA